jgi:predicted ATPase
MVVQDYRIKHVFVNRVKEIATLQDLFEKVQHGSGQIISIQGEHGIGKTKLINEFKRQIEGDQSDQIQFYYGRCNRAVARNPYQPITDALNYKFPTMSNNIYQTDVESELDQNLPADSTDDAPENESKMNNGSPFEPMDNMDPSLKAKPLGLIPFGELTDEEEIDDSEEPLPTLNRTPVVEPLPMGLIPAAFRTTEGDDIKKRRTDLFDTLSKHIFDLASDSPVILVIDDFQWVSPASVNYLLYLTERILNKPIMLLFLYCLDEFNESDEKYQFIIESLQTIENRDNYTLLSLERFNIEEVGAVVKKIFSREDVPESFIEQIFNKTEGNPLYIDNTIRALIEEDIIDISSVVWQTRIDVSQIKIPESTRETLINRLRKFDKNVLKVLSYAAVIGREFTFDLLAQLTEIKKEELLDYIDMILDSKLIREDMASDEDLYRFANPMILDIAYSQLSRSRRRFLHTKLGELIEQRNLNDVGKVVFSLANHYSKGWEYDKALKYLILAGDNAIQMYAIDDSRRYYLSALETLNKFDYTVEIQQREIELLSNLGYTCQMLGDWDQAIEYYSNIPKLIDNIQTKIKDLEKGERADSDKTDLETIPTNWIQLKLADTYWNLAELMRFKSMWDKAEQFYMRSLSLSQQIDDYHGIAQAERGRGYINWRQGEYRKALDHYDICIDFATKINDLPVIAVTYIDIGNIYNYLGEWEQANAYYTESIEHLSKIGWLHEMGRAYNGLGDIFAKQENWEIAIENFERAEEISTEIGDSYKRAYALFNSAECYAKMNNIKMALEKCKLAEEILSRLDDQAGLATVYRNFGIIYHYKKDWKLADEYFQKSILLLKDLKLPYESGYTYLGYGHMLISKGAQAEAKKCFEYSLRIFKNMEAKREVGILEKILKDLKSGSKQKSTRKVGLKVGEPAGKNQKVVS